MTKALLFICAAIGSLLSLSSSARAGAPAHTFSIGEKDFLLDGKPFLIRCGEIHYTRVPREYWRHRLQMCRALGLNTVCVYLFWNKLEWQKGHYDWTGENDAAEFCRLAQQEGLWVLVRPGPYACAEWDEGGLPWWLLKDPDIKLRSQDPAFLEPATAYLKEVARVLGPLQITHGGPILMMQVENEYGSYGKDTAYMGILRRTMIDAGIEVPLFACNPPGDIPNGFRSDLFQVVNFGKNPQKAFSVLGKYQTTGPLMNGEFYPGWFDSWGSPHRTGDLKQVLADLDYMLTNDHSFSIYMAHGGTTWGLWSGADQPFRPDTTSYDYDAPINEAGQVTEKFTQMRKLFSRHLQPGETLPEPPAQNRVITISGFALRQTAPILSNLPDPIRDEQPKTMEMYDQGHGCMLFRTTVPAGPATALTAHDVHDYAWVFLDGKPVGAMDRRWRAFTVQLPARSAPARLDILVEAVGRVNFGVGNADRKGLYPPVQLSNSTTPLSGWDIFRLPLDAAELSGLHYRSGPAHGPAFWRGTFDLAQPGDTYLDLRSWSKGVVWVNGHCLGRFWDIGPTQTMYLPGPWLKKGANEVVVLDLLGPREPQLAGLSEPILDELHPEWDFSKPVRASGAFTGNGLTPVQAGTFGSDSQWQEVRFSSPASGRYLCLQAIDSWNWKPLASVAELEALDSNGQILPRSSWKVLWADSEEPGHEAENALDGQSSSAWLTARQDSPYPHALIIDLGQTTALGGIRYLPSSDPKNPGQIRHYRVFLGDQPFGLMPSSPGK